MSAVNPSDLSRIALFAGLDDSDQRVVATWLDVGEFDPGYKLTHEGASGYAFFVLHDGTADVIVGGKVVRTLGAGDFLRRALDARRRSANRDGDDHDAVDGLDDVRHPLSRAAAAAP